MPVGQGIHLSVNRVESWNFVKDSSQYAFHDKVCDLSSMLKIYDLVVQLPLMNDLSNGKNKLGFLDSVI